MSATPPVTHLPPGARGIRLDDKPTVSVVVASCRDPAELAACLASLEPQCARHRAEVVVARAVRDGEVERLTQMYPAVRWVTAEPQTDMLYLRGMGLAAAQGDIVALIEDHYVVGPEWLAELLEGFRCGPDLGGGVRQTVGDDAVAEPGR